MRRREILIGTGGIAAAAAGGAALFAGSASASVGSHELVGNTIEGHSDDGTVDDVRAGAHSVEFSYHGLNDEADYAEIELQVVHDGKAKTIDSTKVTDLDGTRASGVAVDDQLSGSVFDHPKLNEDDFTVEEDGEDDTYDVTLRLQVTVTTVEGNTASGGDDALLATTIHNIESDADAGGQSDGTVYTPLGENDDGTFSVGVNYGEATSFLVEITADGWPNDEDAANFNLNFDVGGDGDAEDFQVGYHHGDDGEADVGEGGFVKEATGSDRESEHADEYDDVTVEATRTFGEYVVTLEDTHVFPVDHGEAYRWAAAAFDGGEGQSLFITDDGAGVDWSDAENFIDETVHVDE